MKVNQFSLVVGGEAGFGIMTTGLLFAKFCSRLGLSSMANSEYPSLIRGGHNFQIVRVEEEPVNMTLRACDLVVALNKETVDVHQDRVLPGGAIIYDPEDYPNAPGKPGVSLFPIPMNQFTRDVKGEKFLINAASLGAIIALLDCDFSALEDLMRDHFGRKSDEVVERNITVAKKGYDYAKQYTPNFGYRLKALPNPKRKLILTGNEAISLGAIKAGIKFYVAYPMTPASAILSIMAKNERKFNIVVKQSEDEIAAMNMATGAAYTGVRSMTATSGGGFCLMTEAMGMAGLSEVPVVINIGMRGGPSTGLPTQTEQAELQFALHASHGDFPRLVIALADPEEAFYETFNAFNYAERYQTPVVILSDKHMGECMYAVPPFDTSKLKIDRGALLSDQDAAHQSDFKRYKITENGISPRAIPGQKNCINKGTSYEHDEYGYTTEDPGMRIEQVNKRARKLALAEKELGELGAVLHGDAKADLTIVGWGSTKGAILDAMKILKREGKRLNFLQIKYASPFPTEKVAKILGAAKKTLLIEGNSTAQMGSLIREKTGVVINEKLLVYTGKAVSIEEVIDRVRSMV
jgi:2-oxoglutarate/2-oxoacid ferredoxin oxidoreductase subunit alpha